jgi:hypothetical protein
MSETFHCNACGQTCAVVRVLHPKHGEGLAVERDEAKCKVKNAPRGAGQQGELITFAITDPLARDCEFFRRLAQGCTVIVPKQ